MAPPNKDVLVVGIDFGTTHSGAAWCLSSDPGTMKIVNSWPGGASDGIRASGQVPSVISYSQRDVNKHRWGFEVQPETPNQLAWFKLLLNQYAPSSVTTVRKEPNHALMTTAALKQLQAQMELDQHLAKTMKLIPTGKTPVDVVADYMRELVHHTNNALRDTYQQSLVSQLGNSIPVNYVLTVPAVWSDKAKALTLKAAKAAGMNQGERSVRLISEPEAAAMHCLRFYQDSQNCLKVGDIYVVADCGGGTIDLISYEITAITPKLKVKECVAGTGGMCGSTSLNRKFMSMLQERLGPEQYAKQSPRNLASIEKRFDSIKRNFMPTDTDDEDDFDDEDNLIFIPVPGVADNRAASIENGELLLTQKDMISIFVPTFDQITALVKEQVNAAEERSQKLVTGILLVGGFGESKFLKKYLAEKLAAEFGRELEVLQPVDAWSAIVRGAVHDGIAVHQTGELNNGMLESRRARYSYGVPCSLPFVPGVHPVENRYFDKLTCQFYCRGGMSWFIKKNQELVCGEPIKLEMESNLAENYTDDALVQVQSVMVCDSEDPPELRQDGTVESLLVFTNNFKSQKSKFIRKLSPITREPFWTIPVDSVLRYDSAELKFSTEMLGKQVGTAPSVSYSHAAPAGSAGGVSREIEW